ncbi:MAG TPA: hypothetical protein VE912_13110 [Bacteroidales bacterium]|nr:hypothetical protein [Bacteroidales bacterium]
MIQYFNFLEEKRIIFISPLKNYERPKCIYTSHPKFTEQEITNILEKIKIKDHMCFKGKVILELIFSSALRPREIYNLKLIDIDFMADILFIERSQNR